MKALYKLIAGLTLILLLNQQASACQTIAAGLFHSGSNWSECTGANGPGCSDVNVTVAHAMQVVNTYDMSGCPSPIIFTISGSLSFDNIGRIMVPDNSMFILQPGASIVYTGNGNGQNAWIKAVTYTIWQPSVGNIINNNSWPCEVTTGGSCSPLPVELLGWYLRSLEGGVLVGWQTASEENNNFFTVEKSADGISWKEAGKVSGAGTTLEPRSYTYLDEQPIAKTSYYRLSQTDFDGQRQYFDIKSIYTKFDSDELFMHYSSDEQRIYLRLPAEASSITDLRIINSFGAVVQSSGMIYDTQTMIPVGHLPSGYYIVHYRLGAEQGSRKLVITR
jgi:hypothetical protein